MTELQDFKAHSILNECNIFKKEITCSICLDLYTEPVNLTTCQHTFCLQCFKDLFSNETNPKSIKCPLCKKITNRRSFYINVQISAAVELFKMYDTVVSSLVEEKVIKAHGDERLQKFLDDCVKFTKDDQLFSLPASDDESKSILMQVPEDIALSCDTNEDNLTKMTKTPVRKTKKLNCPKSAGKYPRKRKKSTVKNSKDKDDVNKSDCLVSNKIGDTGSSTNCEEDIQVKNKIIKLLEEDFLDNITNNTDSPDNRNKKQESILNWPSKSLESNCSKNVSNASTNGWSRIKKIKKQIKKKEVKYKQLNVSSEINKSKSKSPQETNVKTRNPVVVLNRLKKNHLDKDEVIIIDDNPEDSSQFIKKENTSSDKLDLLLKCIEEDKKEGSNKAEDIFSMCTQILQQDPVINNSQKDDLDEIRVYNEDIKKIRTSTPLKSLGSYDDFKEGEILVEALVHHTAGSDIVEKRVGLKSKSQTIFVKDISELSGEKLDESLRKTAENTVSSTEKTPNLTKMNLRSTSKRNITEKNKISPKRRRTNKKQTPKKDTNLINSEDKGEDLIIKQDLVKNKLKSITEQESVIKTGLENSLNAINVVLSQCSNYLNSESLFSDSLQSKSSKNSNNNAQILEKNKLEEKFQSLPLQSVSRPSVVFYETAIPCLQKIEDFYNQIISLSQEITSEKQNFQNKFSCNEENENKIISLKTQVTKSVAIQTVDIKCPKCCYIFNPNSTSIQNASFHEFKEINDVENISREFSRENLENINLKSKENSQLSAQSSICRSKKVNRQLTYTDDTSTTKNHFKRIRSPSPGTDTNSKKSKTDNEIFSISDTTSSPKSKSYNKFLYRNDVDIFFQSESSEKHFDLSAGSNNKQNKKILKKYSILSNNKENTQDIASKYVSILEKEYKEAEFDSIKPVDKDNFNTGRNTVLDNLLASVDLSAFEDNFEADNKSAEKKTEIDQKDASNKKTDNSLPDILSASMFMLENENKGSNDGTKKIEETVNKPKDHLEEDLMSDSSSNDIFEEDYIVENTPQKQSENKRDRSKFEVSNLPEPFLDLIEPPATVTEPLGWIDIAPPPPPEFQDSEKVEEIINNPQISSATPDLFALNVLDKGFVASNSFISQNLTNPIKEPMKNHSSELENFIPNTISQEKITGLNNTPNIKKNLNPIVLAQKEKFSPLEITVNSSQISKTPILSNPKQQQSIKNYLKTPQKESISNVNKITNSNKSIPAVEVCESPEPKKDLNKTKSSFENSGQDSSILQKSKYKACITSTRLAKDEIFAIISLTQMFNARYTKDFHKNVTHVIVSVDGNNRVRDHTLKYVLGIANSIWILSIAWIRDCLQYNKLLPEEPYEVLDVSGISGPKISRLTRLTNPLFKNFVIHCADSIVSANKSDIENAIVNLGGQIQKSAAFVKQEGKYYLILSEIRATQDFDQFEMWKKNYGVIVVDIEWLSRTVGQYEIVSALPYILCQDEGIGNLGYPNELIAPVSQTQMTMTNTNL